MPDLRDLMKDAADSADGVAAPSDALVEADLVRGRRAQARLARRRALIPAGLAAVAAGLLSFSLLSPGADPGPPAPITAALTAYEGVQPKGFTIDRVPTGWDLQSSTRSDLVIAPKGLQNQNPDEFEGKIVVTLANQNEIAVDRGQTHELRVGDVSATRFWFATEGADGKPVYGPEGSPGLLVPDGQRVLLFQFPEDLHWDDATIAEFAAGVRLTKHAVPGQG